MIRSLWSRYVLIAMLSLLAIGGIATLLIILGFARWTLTVTTGTTLEEGPLFLNAVTQVFAEERPHVHLQRIQIGSFDASAKALENGQADLAVVRSDIAMPKNGLTIAIFRRDSLVLIVPAHSHLETLEGLAGEKVGLLKAGQEEQDSHLERLLDAIMGFYKISPHRVRRVFLSPDEVGTAIAKKEVAGVLALGPAGPGPVAKAIDAITRATKAPPNLVGDEQAEALAKLIPGTESNEIKAGTFGGWSPRPEEDLTTLAVTYRLVGKYTLPDIVAGEIARLLVLAKARLASTSVQAMQIEAPDSEDGGGLPAHPGAVAFYNGEQTSLVDSATSIFYLASIILGIFGSGLAWLLDSWKSPPSDGGSADIDRLIAIVREARGADAQDLDRLEDEIDGIMARSLGQGGGQAQDADKLNILSIAIRQAKEDLNKKRHSTRASKE